MIDHSDKQDVSLRILGLHLNCVSYSEMMDRFDSFISSGAQRAFSVALINVNCCVSALLDGNVRRVYQGADLRGIDSMPFLYLARILKKRDSDRLYAPDMMLKLAENSTKRDYRFFLYGGAPGAPEAMTQRLTGLYPDVKIAGSYSPPFRPMTPEEDDYICKVILESGANVLWVGLGSPKQDIWIENHRSKLPGMIIIASGATFDFFAGLIKQAPRWIQSSGFEWLYRLMQDPVRLWKRYTLYNFLFIGALALEMVGLLRLDSNKSSPLSQS